jgi:hypothetical protein
VDQYRLSAGFHLTDITTLIVDLPGDGDINRFLRNSDLEFDAITLSATLRF